MNRREFLRSTGTAASALTAASIPSVHATGGDSVSIALIGCGGRGSGAADDALSTTSGPTTLVAAADIFEQNVKRRLEPLSEKFKGKVDVPQDRRFIGVDGYKHAIDCLKPGDVAIFATPPAFRWVHFQYAIQKGVNVFMEKPVTVDGPSSRKMLQLAEEATKKNLKVGVGLMIRHCRGRQELYNRIRAGEIGDILSMRAYRMHPAGDNAVARPKPPDLSELYFQLRRFHSFLWASGGLFSDYYIHQIDECSWMKGSWPVKAHGIGGRHFREDAVDQNFDTYSIEYTYADGTKFFYFGRHMNGCHNEFSSFAHGTKGTAVISTSSHTPGRVRIWKGHTMTDSDLTWAYPQPEVTPYKLEWEDLMNAIRNNKPYNEVKRGVEASVVTAMGRMAAHTGHIVTYDEMLNCDHEFGPGLDKLTNDSPSPLKNSPDGKYPVPQPGVQPSGYKTRREYYG